MSTLMDNHSTLKLKLETGTNAKGEDRKSVV